MFCKSAKWKLDIHVNGLMISFTWFGFCVFLILMSRFGLAISGWLLLSIALLVLLYRLATFLLIPCYTASALVRLSADESKQKLERSLIDNRPSFVVSTNVLYPVCDSLDLARAWGQRYLTEGALLTEKGVCALLQSRILVNCSQKENTPVQITIFDEKPREAIEIANATATSLQIQLMHLGGTTKNDMDASVENATTAKRTRPWLTYLPKTLIIAAFLSIIGGVLLRVSRLLPPSFPMSPHTSQRIHVKY